jgi:hypothetical protein
LDLPPAHRPRDEGGERGRIVAVLLHAVRDIPGGMAQKQRREAGLAQDPMGEREQLRDGAPPLAQQGAGEAPDLPRREMREPPRLLRVQPERRPDAPRVGEEPLAHRRVDVEPGLEALAVY